MLKKVLAVVAASIVLLAAAPAMAKGNEAQLKEVVPLEGGAVNYGLGELEMERLAEGNTALRAAPTIEITFPFVDERIMKGNTIKVSVKYSGIDLNTARFSACLSKLVKEPGELNANTIVYDFASGGAVFHAGPDQGEIDMDTTGVPNGTYYLWVMYTDSASNTMGYNRIPVNILASTVFGWYQDSKGWYFLETDGVTRITSAFRMIPHRGMMEYFYFDENTYMVTGWRSINGQSYFFDSEGAMKHDTWMERDGKRYYLNSSGAVVQTGWAYVGGRRFYFVDSSAVSGLYTVDGAVHIFEDSGALATGGLVQVGGKTYFAESDGRAVTGWKDKRYFMPEMAVGFQTIDGKQYGFANDGTVCENGLYQIGDTHYYFVNSAMQTGYHMIDGKNMYFLESGTDAGKRAKGPVSVNGQYKFFSAEGVLDEGTGERDVDGKKYYIIAGVPQTGEHNGRIYGSDFAALTGFQNGVYYEDGVRASNKWVQVGDDKYLLDGEGRVATGWAQNEGRWYYLGSDGKMVTGQWVKDGNWYYLKADGSMAVGWVQDGSTWYYLKGSGAMATGWVQDGSAWYHLKSSGAMSTGWVKDGSNWYYLKGSGAMATGWQQVGSRWYYLKGSGAMLTGWLSQGSSWYYLKPGDGYMLTGTQTIGGKRYTFNSSGTLR